MYGIFTYIWLIFIVNVGKYISYMDPMGLCPFRYRILRVLRLVKVIQPLYMLALGIAEATG